MGKKLSKAQVLADEVIALERWINQNITRSADVAHALRPTGVKKLNRCIDLAENINEDESNGKPNH